MVGNQQRRSAGKKQEERKIFPVLPNAQVNQETEGSEREHPEIK